MKAAGRALLVAIIVVAAGAPWLAPNPPDTQFSDRLYAPPSRIHLSGEHGVYFYSMRLVSRLERRFEERRDAPVRIAWFGRHLLASSDDREPLLLLGADSYGRDIFSRLLYGSRASLGLSV